MWRWASENLLLDGSMGGYKWQKGVNLKLRWDARSSISQGEFEGMNALTGLQEPSEVHS